MRSRSRSREKRSYRRRSRSRSPDRRHRRDRKRDSRNKSSTNDVALSSIIASGDGPSVLASTSNVPHTLDLSTNKELNDAKTKCEMLERELRAKMDQLEESKRKVVRKVNNYTFYIAQEEERLEMLEAKRKLEEEKNELRKEREKLTRKEQTVILGKSGTRPKLQFQLNR
uniref:Uncharacterized protein n=1 Tax=Romanomermis culicivorax TaxID=13658 RepID=A0A915L3D3_ROMCU